MVLDYCFSALTLSEEDSETAIELKLKHIPLYCSVMFTSFPSLKSGLLRLLFAIKEIFDAAKSSAFTVGCLWTLFYIKMQKVAKSRKLECTLDVLCHLYQIQMLLVASVFAALLLFICLYIYFFICFSLFDFYL